MNQIPTMHGALSDEVRPGFEPSMNYYIPQWEERTSYGYRRIDPFGKLFEERIVFLGTPITDDVANAVMAQLISLESMDPRSEERRVGKECGSRWASDN